MILTEPIDGYRCFVVDGTYLRGIYVDVLYPPGEIMQAQCFARWSDQFHNDINMKPPLKNCTCGIHSWITLLQADQYAFQKTISEAILAKIKMWGKIEHHTSGYRAEYAYPSNFYFNPKYSYSFDVRQLANIWGAELTPLTKELYDS